MHILYLLSFALQLKWNPDHHLVAKPSFYFFQRFQPSKTSQTTPSVYTCLNETLKTTWAVGV